VEKCEPPVETVWRTPEEGARCAAIAILAGLFVVRWAISLLVERVHRSEQRLEDGLSPRSAAARSNAP
jgi:hypothetical protein